MALPSCGHDCRYHTQELGPGILIPGMFDLRGDVRHSRFLMRFRDRRGGIPHVVIHARGSAQ